VASHGLVTNRIVELSPLTILTKLADDDDLLQVHFDKDNAVTGLRDIAMKALNK